MRNPTAINDSNILNDIKNYNNIIPTNITQDFLLKYFLWITSSKNNKIIGLEKFPFLTYINGTTQAFESFLIKHNNKRIRCFPGEFMFHKMLSRNANINFKYITNESPLQKNDAFIISLPFSDTGNIHSKHEESLKFCEINNIPVLIDCAYFGVCANIEINLNFSCIEVITFSLSKTFPVEYLRIGIRFTKQDDDDAIDVYNKLGITNKLSASIGLMLIKNYSVDYNFNTYRNKQITICNSMRLQPSNCVIFGLGNDEYKEYNRGNKLNRVCLSKKYTT